VSIYYSLKFAHGLHLSSSNAAHGLTDWRTTQRDSTWPAASQSACKLSLARPRHPCQTILYSHSKLCPARSKL